MSWRSWLRAVWGCGVVLFVVWQAATFQAWGVPSAVLTSGPDVRVEQSADAVSFVPREPIGPDLVFLQGGMVDPLAYAPLCRRIAEHGFPCRVFRASWRMPERDQARIVQHLDRASSVVLGGHSQGAKTAALIAHANPGLVRGLVLLGTSHPRDVDLSARTLPTLKVYAEHDGLASVGEVLQNRPLLPADAQLVEIAGGNHSQFGYLGHLLTDGTATISTEEQHRIAVEAVVTFLEGLERL